MANRLGGTGTNSEILLILTSVIYYETYDHISYVEHVQNPQESCTDACTIEGICTLLGLPHVSFA